MANYICYDHNEYGGGGGVKTFYLIFIARSVAKSYQGY